MGEARSNQGRRSHPFSLMGLLLVGLLLGHDALMAAEARATPRVAMGSMRHAASARPTSETKEAREGTEPAPGHPEKCGVGQAGVTSSGKTTHDAEDLVPAIVSWFSSCTSPSSASYVWEEPHWPLGRRRALLQVYRI